MDKTNLAHYEVTIHHEVYGKFSNGATNERYYLFIGNECLIIDKTDAVAMISTLGFEVIEAEGIEEKNLIVYGKIVK